MKIAVYKEHLPSYVRGILRSSPKDSFRRICCSLGLNVKFPFTANDGVPIKDKFAFDSYWSIIKGGYMDDPCWIKPLSKMRRPVLWDIGCAHGMFSARVMQINPRTRLAGFDMDIGRMEAYMQMFPSAFVSTSEICEKGYSSLDYHGMFFPVPHILKIDVDGNEINVLKGGGWILKIASFIIIECMCPSKLNEIKSILCPLGWKLIKKITTIDYVFRRL